MPTIVTKTIGSAGGRDYSTIATWIAACPTDLVAADQVYRGELYNDSEFVVAAQQTIGSGVTTDATRYIELTVAAGQSFVDHPGVRTNPLRYDASKGVGVTCSTSYTLVFQLAAQYTRINRLQIRHSSTAGGANGGISSQGLTTSNCIADSCLLSWNGGGNAYDSGKNEVVKNCIFIATRTGLAQGICRFYDTATVTNCLFVAPSDVASKPNAAVQNNFWLSASFKNCGFFGATLVASSTTNGTFTNCYTDVASPPAGCTTVAYDTSTGSGFFAATLAYHDFRLRRTSALIGAGTNSGAPTTDITGVTRPMGTNVDVGPWEVVPSNAVFDQVTVDSVSTAGIYSPASADTLTWSHTVNAGNNRALVVMVVTKALGSDATCTYGGVSLGEPIYRVSHPGFGFTATIWVGLAPAVGTADIIFDAGAPAPFLTVDAVSVSCFNVDQASPFLPPYEYVKAFLASPASFTVPYLSGGLVLDIFAKALASQTLTPGAGQTQLGSTLNSGSSVTTAASSKPGGSTSWTFTNSGTVEQICYGAVCLKPSFTLGTKHHPVGDIGQPQWASPSGWKRWEALDETTASDSDYVFADVGSAPYVMEIGPLAAGTYTTRLRASVASGTGTLTIRLLDASLAVLATSSPQTVTTTPTTFTPDLTFASGTAYYISAEITA